MRVGIPFTKPPMYYVRFMYVRNRSNMLLYQMGRQRKAQVRGATLVSSSWATSLKMLVTDASTLA